MKPGKYESLSNEEYHAGPGLSKSGMDLLLKSPLHYLAAQQEEQKPTPSMIFGTAVHAAVLEPDLFTERYVKAPDINRRTKAGKEEYAAFQAENKGKTILPADDYATVEAMRLAVLSSPPARKLLSGGKAEQSYFWEDGQTGTLLKCRPDYLRPDGIIIDLKTTPDGSPQAFSKSCANFNYHMQAAVYTEGVNALGEQADHFVFIVIEKKLPFAVACYTLDSEAVDQGRILAREAINRYSECREKDHWPGYSAKIESLSLPAWAYR